MTGRDLPRTREAIAALIPHSGASVLLDEVLGATDGEIVAATNSHLEPGNPLRRSGRLPAVCGLEYALQAAALHGALRDGGAAQPTGFFASARGVTLGCAFLDDPAHGRLRVTARERHGGPAGMIYELTVAAEGGRVLVAGTATVAFP